MVRWRASRLGWLVLALVLIVACDAEQEASVVAEDEEREQYYSPYYLSGEGAMHFQTITFTDVGIKQPDPGPAEPVLLETIAESLALEIAAAEELSFSPEVHYDHALLDPANHLFCEQHHLYIALWRGYDPERWGYSLWSGCSDYQEFAWKEVPAPGALDQVDPVTQVTPLTEAIVESLKQAHQSECYTAQC